MPKLTRYILFLLVVGIAFSNCKEKPLPDNPFDDPALQPPETTDSDPQLDPVSFAGLHQQVFRPTCANSGCHDGTFEPDFRTVESSYATLVFHPMIKNDPAGSYEYRVVPNDAANSVLYQRLLIDIDGQSGIMPLAVDPGSDWNSQGQEHIENLRLWIESGAKDIMGNEATPGNQLPTLVGVAGYLGGSSTLLDREPGKGPIQVPQGTGNLELWIAASDAETATPDLTVAKIRFAINSNGFEGVADQNLTQVSSPRTAEGYFGSNESYYHRITIDASSYSAGTTVFMRVYFQDTSADPTELPADGSAYYIKEYAAFIIQ